MQRSISLNMGIYPLFVVVELFGALQDLFDDLHDNTKDAYITLKCVGKIGEY